MIRKTLVSDFEPGFDKGNTFLKYVRGRGSRTVTSIYGNDFYLG